jgi:Tfp pilus assembly protein PilW
MSRNCKFNKQDGFSMMELMISLVTTLVVTGAAFALIGSSIKFSNSIYNTTEAEQSLRTAQEWINRDLTSAGDGLKSIGTFTVPTAFLSGFLTRTPVANNLGLVTSDDGIPAGTAIPQASPAATFQASSDRISMLIKDKSFSDVSVSAGKISQSGSNTIITLNSTTNTTNNDIAKFHAGEIYAIISDNATLGYISSINTTNMTLTFTNADTFSLNQTGATSPIYSLVALNSSLVSTLPASIVRIQIIQYLVDSTGLLRRRVFGVQGAAFTDNVIAEHVTNLQFRYLTNLPDANGFVKQPVRVISTGVEQAAVRQIETSISVETVRAVNALTNGNANSGKQTVSTTTATTVRNLQFRDALSP